MTRTPRDKLMRLADRYWSNPAARLEKVNYKRRHRGMPERSDVTEIETSGQVARRIRRDDLNRFTV